MTSWIVVIDSKYPQHWGIAKARGFWDMTSMQQIALGDTIYFWQGGGSLVAQCSATSTCGQITDDMEQPWEDSGEREYKARFEFDLLSEAPRETPAWGTLQKRWGKPYLAQLGAFRNPAEAAVLADYFDTDPITAPYSDDERDRELEKLGFDMRTFAWRSIAQRQGQKEFRQRLMAAYVRRCAVTGTRSEHVLEAAHIARYKGPHTNRTSNGLLLRADIHTLFDLHRITVTPDLVIRVAPSLTHPYLDLDGQQLRLPAKPTDRPMPMVLEEHNAECDWL